MSDGQLSKLIGQTVVDGKAENRTSSTIIGKIRRRLFNSEPFRPQISPNSVTD